MPLDPLLFVDNDHDCSRQSTIPNLKKILKRNHDSVFTMKSKNDKNNYVIKITVSVRFLFYLWCFHKHKYLPEPQKTLDAPFQYFEFISVKNSKHLA